MLTYILLKTQSMQQQVERARQMLTYILFKNKNMLLLAKRRKDQTDGDLQTVQNQEHAPVSNRQ
jgi:hypothetical protein